MKRFRVAGMGPPQKPERLGSPALYAQRRLISATGRAETESEGQQSAKKRGKKRTRKRVASK